MKRAIETCDDSLRLKQFEEYLGGPTIFLFTDLNPFKLVLLLEKNKVKTIARSGDVAANDVVVPAGNTGLPPGPIISQLSAVRLPSRIESGSVWITRDTPVAKKGEVISERLAAVLSKLNIKSVEVGLTMNVVYDDGTVITKDQLQLDVEGLRQQITEVNTQALNLSLNAEYPLPENIALLLQMNHQQAFNLAITACVLTSATSAILVRKAHMQMLSLSKRIGWTLN
jgi:large subunit ribosomal protein L10